MPHSHGEASDAFSDICHFGSLLKCLQQNLAACAVENRVPIWLLGNTKTSNAGRPQRSEAKLRVGFALLFASNN